MSFFFFFSDSWGSMLKALVFLAICACGLFLFVTGLFNKLDPSSLSLSTSGDISVTFGSSELRSMLIHPRGWQCSKIEVKKGDKLSLDASGEINIAMGRMVQCLIRQYQHKEDNEADPNKGRDLKFFSDEQLKESIFPYPWVGPEGILLEHVDELMEERIRGVHDRLLDTNANHAELLAVIGPDTRPSYPSYPLDRSNYQIIRYSQGAQTTATKSGVLWFIINDQMHEDDDDKRSKILWQDNLGVFEVAVVVERM